MYTYSKYHDVLAGYFPGSTDTLFGTFEIGVSRLFYTYTHFKRGLKMD